MKRIVTFSVAAIIMVCSCICVHADDFLTVENKNFIEYDGDNNGFFFAKIVNTGSSPIAVGGGKLVAFSENDDILLSEDYINSNPSYTLIDPDDYIYVRESFYDNALESSDIADYKFSIESRESGTKVQKLPCEAEYKFAGNFDNYVYVTFTNTTSEIIDGPYITVALYDTDGNLIFVNGDSASALAVHPNSTVTIKLYVEGDMVKYYNSRQISVGDIDALVYYEV